MTATRVHPLRFVYIRTLQAILAVHITRVDTDEAFGGDPHWLDEIEARLTEAYHLTLRLAAAERVNLGDEDEE